MYEVNCDVVVAELTTVVPGARVEDTYVRFLYSGGTPCDLGDKVPRSTEVRFHCAPSDTSIAALDGITETTSCQYILKVKTRLLCTHPAFAPQAPAVHEISCRPGKACV